MHISTVKISRFFNLTRGLNFGEYYNEIFFAKYIILVEGDSDKILWNTIIEDKWGISLNRNGISIIECGGKGGVMYFIGVMRLMGITDYFAIWDKDSGADHDAHGQLKFSLENGKGLELSPTLEKYLKVYFVEQQFREDYKIEDAFKWSSEVKVDEIPKDFLILKEQLEKVLIPEA